MNQLLFTLIIPCFNEENAIQTTISQLRTHLKNVTHYELIVVNDGSTDKTSDILDEIKKKDSHLHLVTHERNQGYGAALKTGIRRAKAEWIVITDADGTYPNQRIPELFELTQNADMVIGARIAEEVTYPFIRKIPKWFLSHYASWIAGCEIPDMNSGLRIFRRAIAEKFLNILPNGFSFTTTITLAMLTNHYNVRFVPIEYYSRIGQSKIKPLQDTLKFVQLIIRTGIYFAPLRVFMPFVILLSLAFLVSLSYDVFVLSNITDKTLILLMFSMNTTMFALLADMIDKRI